MAPGVAAGTAPLIALIHATPVAMAPIADAFAEGWPEARLFNLLDDGLSSGMAQAGRLTPELSQRIRDLADHAHRHGADAILFTCSAFGPAIEAAARDLDVPVLKPNEAMYQAALDSGGRAAMILTFAPARASMEAEYAEAARARGAPATLDCVLAEGALEALAAGDGARHDALVAEAAERLPRADVVMLGQFSTARAAPHLAGGTARILTSPGAAVQLLRHLLTDPETERTPR